MVMLRLEENTSEFSSVRGGSGTGVRIGKSGRGSAQRLLGFLCHFSQKRILCDVLVHPYARLAHRRVLRSARRSQSHIYTSFCRSPSQLEALASHVVPFVARGASPRTLLINVLACSTGAEAYTVASALMATFPRLDFRVCASDLHEETVAKAKAACCASDEVFLNDEICGEFIARTFDHAGDNLIVKRKIREKVSFTRANLLDRNLVARFDPADIVFAQNVLFHLEPDDAVNAFDNLLRLAKVISALFIDGMELDMKEQLTAKAGLEPLAYRCREIYSYARKHIPARWWRHYHGVEPYSVFRIGRRRRYSTIFLRHGEPQAV